MPGYLFPIIVFACLVFYPLFGRSRKNRLERVLLQDADKRYSAKFMQVNVVFSVLATSASCIVAVVYSFLPKWHYFLIPMPLLDSVVPDYIGMFLVKIAFMANIIVCFQVTDKFTFEFMHLTKQALIKMELVILFPMVLLHAGVFLLVSNVVSLAILLVTLFFVVYRWLRSLTTTDPKLGT